MPAQDDDERESAQKDLLQELRDLQTVLDAEKDDAIPILSDVVLVRPAPSDETPVTTEDSGAAGALLGDEPNSTDNSIPVSESVTTGDSEDSDNAEPATNDQSLDQLLAAQASKSGPFALIDSADQEYDSSAAESLIEDGLNEALRPLTQQMDDEALRLVEELVAEHSELIRQELTLRLDAKSKEVHAELAAQRDDLS